MRPTKTRPNGLRPHDMTGCIVAMGLSEPVGLVAALSCYFFAVDSERWPGAFYPATLPLSRFN